MDATTRPATAPAVTLDGYVATVSIAGLTFSVDLRDDRDDWALPEELSERDSLRALYALDDASREISAAEWADYRWSLAS